MIPFRTPAQSSVSLGRRRGTTSGSGGILSSRALFLLAALCASVRIYQSNLLSNILISFHVKDIHNGFVAGNTYNRNKEKPNNNNQRK